MEEDEKMGGPAAGTAICVGAHFNPAKDNAESESRTKTKYIAGAQADEVVRMASYQR